MADTVAVLTPHIRQEGVCFMHDDALSTLAPPGAAPCSAGEVSRPTRLDTDDGSPPSRHHTDTAPHTPTMREMCCRTARLSWILAAVAGLVGAAAFTHSAGYFVTFMTGNSERAVLGYFRGDTWLSVTAGLIILAFVGGVVIASLCRRHLWEVDTPHGPTVLTALFLVVAAAVDITVDGWNTPDVSFVPVIFVALGVGALNTSFVKGGEVSIPLSYVTGTLVKLGQGIERHISGGQLQDWFGYFMLWLSFVSGAVIGGCISLIVSGSQMIATAALACVVLSAITQIHTRRDRVRYRAELRG